MATVVTKTVKPSGGDYTSLAAAEAGEQRDLVAADQIAKIDCYAMLDSTVCTIAGWTTDSTRYIFVRVPPSERHSGRRDATKYRLEASVIFGHAFTVGQNYTRVQGMQVRNTSSSPKSAFSTSSAAGVVVVDSIAYDVAASSQPADAGFYMFGSGSSATYINCAALNCAGTGFTNGSGVGAVALNCTVLNCPGNSSGVGNGFSGGGFTLKNCYAGGCVSAAYANGTLTNCYSDDGSLGSTVAAKSLANFANVTPGSEDLSLVSGSALIDAGTNLSADPNWLHPDGAVDIIGTTRPQGAAWDVGVFEYVAAGASTVVGAAALSITMARTVAAHRVARGAAVLALTTSQAAVAKLTAKGAVVVALTLARTASARRTAKAAATLPLALTVGAAGFVGRVAQGAASMALALTAGVTARRNARASSPVSLTLAMTAASHRRAKAAAVAAVTLNAAAAGRRKTRAAATLAVGLVIGAAGLAQGPIGYGRVAVAAVAGWAVRLTSRQDVATLTASRAATVRITAREL